MKQCGDLCVNSEDRYALGITGTGWTFLKEAGDAQASFLNQSTEENNSI